MSCLGLKEKKRIGFSRKKQIDVVEMEVEQVQVFQIKQKHVEGEIHDQSQIKKSQLSNEKSQFH